MYFGITNSLRCLAQGQDEFSRATILGDGTVALVIDPNKLIRNLMSKEEMTR